MVLVEKEVYQREKGANLKQFNHNQCDSACNHRVWLPTSSLSTKSTRTSQRALHGPTVYNSLSQGTSLTMPNAYTPSPSASITSKSHCPSASSALIQASNSLMRSIVPTRSSTAICGSTERHYNRPLHHLGSR